MGSLRLVRYSLSSLVIAALVFGAAGGAVAAQYPVKPIDFYVGSAPGGGSDIMARNVVAVVEKLKLLPQPLVVINQPGVTKTYPHVARKPADGYTFCIGNETYSRQICRCGRRTFPASPSRTSR